MVAGAGAAAANKGSGTVVVNPGDLLSERTPAPRPLAKVSHIPQKALAPKVLRNSWTYLSMTTEPISPWHSLPFLRHAPPSTVLDHQVATSFDPHGDCTPRGVSPKPREP